MRTEHYCTYSDIS